MNVDMKEVRPHDIARVVAIFYYGRSGSLFAQSLLDGHPDVLTIPANYLSGYYSFWKQFGNLAPIELIAAFIQNYEVFFDPTSCVNVIDVGVGVGLRLNFHEMGERHNESLGIDRDLFSDALLRLVLQTKKDKEWSVDRKFFFQAVHLAYSEALGRNFRSKTPIIVFQGHNPYPNVVDQLIEDFSPHVQFLHCVREPIQSLASWYTHMRDGIGDLELDLPLRTLHRSIAHASPILVWNEFVTSKYRNSKFLVNWNDGNSGAIRLEDLHLDSRNTLQQLCDWLEIGWDDELMRSTFDGKLWHWRIGGEIRSGFQRRTISKTHSEVISKLDRFRLQFLLSDKFVFWGYSQPRYFNSPIFRTLSMLLWILPFKMENTLWAKRGSYWSKKSRSNAAPYFILRVIILVLWWRVFRRSPSLIRPIK